MDIQIMKLIDELLGPPICLIFHFYNAAKRPFVKYKLSPNRVNNILLIKFFGMGSILLAGPMMRALRNRFPKARIIFLTFSSNEGICRQINLIDEVICVETENFSKFIISTIKAIFKIRSKCCQISIDLEFFAKTSTLIQYLCGTKIRVGYYLIQIGIFLKMMWRGNLLTHQVYYNPHKHTIEAFLALAKSLDADTNDLRLAEVEISEEDKKKTSYLLEEENIKLSDFLIAININSSPLCLERRWPMENFAYLIYKFQTYKKIKIVLIGDKKDKEYVKNFLMSLNSKSNIVDLTGRLDIGSLSALSCRINLLITNDSGPMHLAASLGTPIVALFGPETPVRFGPVGGNHLIFYPDIYCSPCLNVYNQKIAPCNGKNLCMRMILPEKVYEAIKERYLYEL